jgi:hypothetical protein
VYGFRRKPAPLQKAHLLRTLDRRPGTDAKFFLPHATRARELVFAAHVECGQRFGDQGVGDAALA